MFGKKKKKLKWLKPARAAYRKGKLAGSYGALFNYYYNTVYLCHGIDAHFEYLRSAKSGGYLDAEVNALRSVLPQDLRENFDRALEKFIALGDDPEYEEIEDAFDEYDDYTDDHACQMEEILEKYITDMKEKRLI